MSSIHQLREFIDITFSPQKIKDLSLCSTHTQTKTQNIDEYFASKGKTPKHKRNTSLTSSDASSKRHLMELIIPSKKPRLSSGLTRIKRDIISLKKVLNTEAYSPSGFRNRPKINLTLRNLAFDKRKFLAQSPTQKCVVLPRNRNNMFKQMLAGVGKKKINAASHSDKREYELFVRGLSKDKNTISRNFRPNAKLFS